MATDTDSGNFRRFALQRDDDISGLSGVGMVAYGVQFPDGRVAVRWKKSLHQGRPVNGNTAVWDDIEQMIAIHGHEGRTIVYWID